jgi:RNA polymerase-binding protein DksA
MAKERGGLLGRLGRRGRAATPDASTSTPGEAPAKPQRPTGVAKTPDVAAPAVTAAPARGSTAPAKAPAKKAPAKKAPANKAPAKPATKAPAAKQAATKAPAQKSPAQKSLAQKAPAQKAPAQKAPAAAGATKVAAKKGTTSRVPAKATPAKATKATPTATKAAAKAPRAAKATKTAKATKGTKAAKTAKKAEPAPAAASSTTAAPPPFPSPPDVTTPVTKVPATVAGKVAAAPARKAAGKPGLLPRLEGDSPWTAKEVAALRAAIDAEVIELRTEIEASDAAHDRSLQDGEQGTGDDTADAGSATFEREHELSIAANSKDLLAQNTRALQRLDAGTYGLCEICGEPIGKERLKAFPKVTLCVTCKQREMRR